MTLTIRTLAGGAGWQASDVMCDAGPADAPYEEQHERICMAVGLRGTFNYRSSRGLSTLAPGAILLGNPGDCFPCGHEHSIGDRCLSFHFDPAVFEGIVAHVPGATCLTFASPVLFPHRRRAYLLPQADAALDDPAAIEELAYDLATSVATAGVDPPPRIPARGPNTRRVEELVHWIETEADQPLPLASLAQKACLSPYHLLREFKRVTGISPHQFILAQRLRRAARKLRHSNESVLNIALASGFSDLSEFNRRFRRVLGPRRASFGSVIADKCVNSFALESVGSGTDG